MSSYGNSPVMLVPGIVNPVALSYGPLINALAGERRLILKELEVYLPGQVPPPGYSVGMEVDGIATAANDAGVDTFHLVGYSAGGLAALGAVERFPERLRSVTLIEPFGTGSYEISAQERAFLDYTATVLELPQEVRVAAFLPMNLRAGVQPPEVASGHAPAWMASRPAGVVCLIQSAIAARFEVAILRAFEQPVYFVMGSLSSTAWYAMRDTLAGIFPNIKAEVYEGLHHLSPPQRAEPARFAEALRGIWRGGDKLMDGR